jgi:hypothetical protein
MLVDGMPQSIPHSKSGRQMHLQVLSLSVNGISSLRDFMHCKELRELYLRKNNVANLNDIRSASPAAAGCNPSRTGCSTGSLQHSWWRAQHKCLQEKLCSLERVEVMLFQVSFLSAAASFQELQSSLGCTDCVPW